MYPAIFARTPISTAPLPAACRHPGPPMKDFPDVLERLWWRLNRALLDIDVEYSALVCLVDAIKHGTTTLINHHASPNAINDSLDQIADAVELASVAALCYEVTDRNGAAGAQAGIDENVRFLYSLQERGSGLLSGTFGLHASLSLSDETLADCVAASRELDTGFSIIAEAEADEYDSLYKYEQACRRAPWRKPVFWGPRVLPLTASMLIRPRRRCCARPGPGLHHGRAAMNNAVGAADIEGMLRFDMPAALATTASATICGGMENRLLPAQGGAS